jgi:hypothetical protein
MGFELPARTDLGTAALLVLAACGGGASSLPPPEEPAGPPERPQVTIALRFEEAPDDAASGEPRTRVVLARIIRGEDTQTTEVAVVAGACSHAWPGRGVLLRARCSWASAREEIVVSQDDDEIVARAGESTEVRVELPENALVEVLQPDTMPTEGTGTPPSIMVQPEAIPRR